jgi:hypothetical protein
MEAKVIIDFPEMEAAVMQALFQHIDKALNQVAPQVQEVIRDQAMLENQDVDGQAMPNKQARPKKSPKNFPNLPLVVTGDLMDTSRWSIERPSTTQADVIYNPPPHFQYLLDKPKEQGGRRWLTHEKVNPNARRIIEERLRAALEGRK